MKPLLQLIDRIIQKHEKAACCSQFWWLHDVNMKLTFFNSNEKQKKILRLSRAIVHVASYCSGYCFYKLHCVQIKFQQGRNCQNTAQTNVPHPLCLNHLSRDKTGRRALQYTFLRKLCLRWEVYVHRGKNCSTFDVKWEMETSWGGWRQRNTVDVLYSF